GGGGRGGGRDRPGGGRGAANPERRPRGSGGPLRDELVPSVTVSLERPPLPRREPREQLVQLGGGIAVAPHHLVHEEVARAQSLGEPSGTRPSQDIHREDPVLGLRVAVAGRRALTRT